MRRLISLMVVPVLAAAACGTVRDDTPGSAPSTSAAVTPTTLVASGQAGTTVIDSTGRIVAELGQVVGAPGWTRADALEADTRGNTVLRAVDARTGATVTTSTLNGHWQTVSAYAAGPSGFSPGGRWLVLAGPGADRSAFLLVDATGQTQPRRIEVAGHFDFDAVSDNGESLYLVERLGGTQYRVRVVDVRSRLLLPAAIVDVKQLVTTADANGVMNGTWTSSTPGPNGEWFFSVYQHPLKGPYIHALNTTSRIAECILDLPTFGKAGAVEMAKQPFWSLVLGQRQTTTRLYAVNAVLGQVALIDPDEIKVKATSSFKVAPPTASAPAFTPRLAAAVSPDGYRLYAVGESGIVVLDAIDLSLRATFQQNASFRSLAVSSDDATLFALAADGMSIAALDARTGLPLATLPLRVAADSLAIQAR